MFVRGNRIRLKHDNQDRSLFCAVCKTKGHFRLECPQLLVLQRFVDLDNPPEDPSEEILTWPQARAKADEKQKQRQINQFSMLNRFNFLISIWNSKTLYKIIRLNL